MRVRARTHDGVEYREFACPGCKSLHSIPVTGPRAWTYNRNDARPTFQPSIRCTYTDGETQKVVETCHSFVRDGRIEFLPDCTHELKGQTVDLAEIPEPT